MAIDRTERQFTASIGPIDRAYRPAAPGPGVRFVAAGLWMSGLVTCSQPEVLTAPLAQPSMAAPLAGTVVLPAIAEPTGEPPIERDLARHTEDPS